MKNKLQFHPVAWGIIFGTFISRAGYFMSIPFLGIYLNKAQGFDPVTIGSILAISYLVGTFMSFIGGSLSDKFGRYPVMILSMMVWGVVFAGFAFAESAWMFFVLNSLSGICRSCFEPTARALLADITKEEDRAAVFNARYFAINLGGAIGPLAGVWLGASRSTLPFLISAVIYGVYGLMIYFWKAKYVENEKVLSEGENGSLGISMGIIKKDRTFCYFLIGNIFVTAGYAHLDTTLSQYMGNHDVHSYSILFMANTMTILLIQYPVIRYMKRFSALTSLKTGSLFFGAGILGFGLSHSIIILILSMILFTIGEILCFIIGDVLIGEIAPEHLRGAYFGASGFQFIGQSGGAWIGGWLLNLYGFDQGPMIFGILAILTLAAYPFYQIGQHELEKGKTVKLENMKNIL